MFESGNQGQWTIHDKSGQTVLAFDVFLACDYRNESRVPSQPVEEGGFASYNKVASPATVSVKLAKSGKPDTLGNFLAAVKELESSLELYSVVTPERTLTSMNVVAVRYNRQVSEGVDRVVVELGLQEIRQVTPAYQDGQLSPSSVRHGSDASGRIRGKQQGEDASTAEKERSILSEWWR